MTDLTTPASPTGKTPHVSVNMPVYNTAAYIRQTLDALLAQTYQDWECIIVDDASTDDTAAIAREYAQRDPRIQVHVLDAATKQPYPACRNKAVELSRGKWIAPLDGDDWWEPWKLERQVAFAESDPNVVICCARAWMWRNGKVTGESIKANRDNVRDILPLRTVTVHPAVLLDRQSMIDLGMYDLAMRTAQDWDLWLKYLWKYGPEGFAFMDEPVMYYRMHDKNVSNSLKCLTYEWMIVRRTLARYGWGLKNPIRAWRVLDFKLPEDAQTYHRAGVYPKAFTRALWAILIHPIGGWRFKLLRTILQDWRKGRQPAASAPRL